MMARPWTQPCVAALYLLRSAGCARCEMAYALGRSETDIDRAVWSLLGRTIPDAVAALNRPRLVESA